MNPTQQRQNFRANSSKQSDADTLREARDLVDQYLHYLKLADLGLDVVDIDDLPFRKQLLVSAVRLLIATESSATTRQQLRKVGLTLASFQDDIGQRMTMRPLPSEERMREEELQAEVKKHRHLIARFDRAFAAMASERVRLDELFQQSMRMAERRESNAAAASRRSNFEAGGTYSPYL
ncbi:hypothetical protein [Rhizobium tumorigenes]|uniref:hypothetical protein n=1 Tax=Rhizobium tumorigenes TaxID=2041385 RepID=UPI00241E83F7|nr:hypothetical protein [Rhizobium tumorigenes]WFS00286.1 hypothetical protein PR016_14210 [Rhizobium tumorigenes]